MTQRQQPSPTGSGVMTRASAAGRHPAAGRRRTQPMPRCVPLHRAEAALTDTQQPSGTGRGGIYGRSCWIYWHQWSIMLDLLGQMIALLTAAGGHTSDGQIWSPD